MRCILEFICWCQVFERIHGEVVELTESVAAGKDRRDRREVVTRENGQTAELLGKHSWMMYKTCKLLYSLCNESAGEYNFRGHHLWINISAALLPCLIAGFEGTKSCTDPRAATIFSRGIRLFKLPSLVNFARNVDIDFFLPFLIFKGNTVTDNYSRRRFMSLYIHV